LTGDIRLARTRRESGRKNHADEDQDRQGSSGGNTRKFSSTRASCEVGVHRITSA
jgi:hypothetical protein